MRYFTQILTLIQNIYKFGKWQIIHLLDSLKPNLQLKIDYFEVPYFPTKANWTAKKKSSSTSHVWGIK